MRNNRFKIGKDKPYKTIEAEPYVFTFYLNKKNLGKDKVNGTYLRISSRENRQFGINIPGNTDAYSFLLAAAGKSDNNQLRDYAKIIFAVSMLLTTDQTFANDICRALVEWQERRMADGAKEAEKVTDEQEQVSQTFMEDVAEFADAKTDKERDELREGWKDEIKEVLKDGDTTDNQQDS